jgi:hypothetical protein
MNEPTFEDFGLTHNCPCGAVMAIAWDQNTTVVLYHGGSPLQTINALPGGIWPPQARSAIAAALREVHARLQPLH